ncbi:hypothetical protein [Epilithonimonas arachidiradicis]|uniref:Uncharacterized protein n=1 Tax=Epilithonimonas arachidiradicis TaxID=1617282 RepID=A0A420CLE1_9FLAO|nr:hypothetical protein [Epilithonimonas arachidiradicis]RKE79113.1 hypothetical protein BXY58_3375 [Epilithonimonas arachidiradicis]
MKISNKKNIERLGLFLMLMLILDIALIGLQWLIVRQPDRFIIVLLILFIALTIYLSKLQYTEFESSGLVITIKKKNLFSGNSFVFPLVELPVQLIKNCELKSQVLYIRCETCDAKEKTRNIKINIIGFNKQQQNCIVKNLPVCSN